MDDPELVGLKRQGPTKQSIIFPLESGQVQQRLVIHLQYKLLTAKVEVKPVDGEDDCKALSFDRGVSGFPIE